MTVGNTLTLNIAFALGVTSPATTQLVKNDNGILELNAANSGTWTGSAITAAGASAQVLTGGVLVNAGILRMNNPAALGAAANIVAVNTTQGAAVQIAGGITVPNPLVSTRRPATATRAASTGAAHCRASAAASTNTWSGAISENQDAGITADAGNTLNITGGIT